MRPAWKGPKVDSAKQHEEEIKKITDRRNRQIQFIHNSDKQDNLESEFFRLHGDRIAELDYKANRAEINELMNELKEIKHKSPFYKPIFASLHPSWKNLPRVHEKPKWYLNWQEDKRKKAESQQSAGRMSRKNIKNNKNKSIRVRRV